uniref:Mitochondrial carrier protein n=1 Tax=Pycnococcus provasolii TaxID=41880 RepID=A0A7S2F8P7_9CHLO|mmetsp:Transcript_4029/g.9112  ORF Transcript_4029/g.9112 Transcript_4029/m.9112 type:complete len:304 (+) Transcript_4029:294-1205(+)
MSPSSPPAPPAPAPAPASSPLLNLALGPTLQCLEAASLGMPFEVWKTRMARFRGESTITAFQNIYREGGVSAFWAGTGAKMVESATKGGVLLVSKEAILNACQNAGLSPTFSGIIAGAGGGVAQTSVMGPTTFLVTAAVTSKDKSVTTTKRIVDTWQSRGLAGFYPGGLAIAFRQASNWASRQGFTEAVRAQVRAAKHPDNSKLTRLEELQCGIVGGVLSSWNHPFEVARVEAQARAAAGEPALGFVGVVRHVVHTNGVSGLFAGILPRIGLNIWQTLFMVTLAKVIKQELIGGEDGSNSKKS